MMFDEYSEEIKKTVKSQIKNIKEEALRVYKKR